MILKGEKARAFWISAILFATAIGLYIANYWVCWLLGIGGEARHAGWIILFLYWFLRAAVRGAL